MSLISELLEKPATLSKASKYTAMNGFIYFGAAAVFIFWPGVVQTLFMDAPFAGKEEALFRVLGMALESLAGSTCSAVVPAGDNSSPRVCSIDGCSFPRCSCR